MSCLCVGKIRRLHYWKVASSPQHLEPSAMSDGAVAHSHLVQIDGGGTLSIYRVFSDGTDKQFYKSIFLPRMKIQEDKEGFEQFAGILGENILMDSPQARDALGI